ncbi:hypothetical protein K469DRAFT_723733 [Zopfia rhizophila CBS 207.26]|uniref:Uncharacterized protein n=1 Tax=Zopfia rhizophila CBS 207.26 TaxID=1314779 RepID=A0A6A6EIX6_9PEZI|nr:hypothetical protein K469DRAFT_723733 [Zopfia rhizophila CBS 207.26]
MNSNLGSGRAGSIDHVFDILTAYDHPFIVVGVSAHRWMGCAAQIISDEGFDMVLRNNELDAIAADLVKTGHWTVHHEGPKSFPTGPYANLNYDVDVVLERTDVEHGSNEYRCLRLWYEKTYRINVDQCLTVEVPDVYPWVTILFEEKYHLAIYRDDGWWYGPHLHCDSKAPNFPSNSRTSNLFPPHLPRGKSPSNSHPILIPSIPAYLDALIYHNTQYKDSKPRLSFLPHQRLPLLLELEGNNNRFMDYYLQHYKRKPRYILPKGSTDGKLILVKEWDPVTYPDYLGKQQSNILKSL